MTDSTDKTTKRGKRSLLSLVVDVPRLLRELVEAEIAQLKAEIVSKLKSAGIGAGFLVVAATFAFFATLVLTAAAILALSLVLPGWAAALIVAGALLLLAGIAAAIGAAQLKSGVPPTPTATIDSIKEDVRVVRGLRKRGTP